MSLWLIKGAGNDAHSLTFLSSNINRLSSLQERGAEIGLVAVAQASEECP